MSDKELNARQLRFVEEYLIDNNATQAAIRAGYSPNTAESQGSRLLRYAKVADAVNKGRKTISENIAITRERLLEMAEKVYDGALGAEQYSAATGAIKEMGILSGERVEKTESTVVPHEERLAAIRERLGHDGKRPTTH